MLEQKQALKCISYNYWEEVDHKVGVVKQKNLFAKGILIGIYTLYYYLPIQMCFVSKFPYFLYSELVFVVGKEI